MTTLNPTTEQFRGDGRGARGGVPCLWGKPPRAPTRTLRQSSAIGRPSMRVLVRAGDRRLCHGL
jgi:hypothetical protein